MAPMKKTSQKYTTEQEAFWAGEFGHEYLKRNTGEELITSNIVLFSQVLRCAPGVKSITELGCNIGLNLQALHRINHQFKLGGYEINERAAGIAAERNIAEVVNATILDDLAAAPSGGLKADLTFTKGVLIHINPDELAKVYRNLVTLSNRYVMVCEYYNPTPMAVSYRGNEDRLFKRDFAGELMDQYHLKLVDYGFCYHRDNYLAQGDSTWFLLEK